MRQTGCWRFSSASDYADVLGPSRSSRRPVLRAEVGITRRSAQNPLRRCLHNGFTRAPFGKAIPAHQLFSWPSHEEAVARIRFCVQERLLGVVVGEVGAGKTVAARAAVSQLDPTAHQVIYLSNPPALGTRGLYVTLVSALGAQPRFFKAEVMAQAQTLLAAEELERRRRVVLIVDEGHLLTPEQLEELRLLTNADMDATNPFALLMVGQPMLLRRLKMGSFAALDQRLSMRYQLQPLDLAETVQYLRHQLAWAGRTEPLFADDAVARLHQASRAGLPALPPHRLDARDLRHA